MDDNKQKEIFRRNLLRYLGTTPQAEVAKAINVSPQTFNTWCQGKALPRIGKVQSLADYFGINKSDLIEEKSSDNEIENEEYLELARKIQSLSKSDKEALLSYVEYILSKH